MSDDIVTRLRQIPTAWPLVREAADEIERLRRNTGCARNQRSTQFCAEALDAQREVARLTAERDEIRLSYCLLMEAYRGGDGRVTANKLGWGYLFAEDSK